MKRTVCPIDRYDTGGEQFHCKLFASFKDKKLTVIIGSANFTRRNLANFNLELNVKLVAERSSRPAQQIASYFTTLWANNDGDFTVDYSVYKETSLVKTMLYRIQERFGLGTF